MAFVLDASMTAAFILHDEKSEVGVAVLSSLLSDHAMVPSLWTTEMASVLLKAVRNERLSLREMAGSLSRLVRLPIYLDPQPPRGVWLRIVQLALRHNLSAYDATYLELVKRVSLPLATLDRELSAAALAEGMPLFAPPSP